MNLGFIGAGNMARAMLAGIAAHTDIALENILVSDRSDDAREKITQSLGIRVTSDNGKVAAHSDMLVLAVKPAVYPDVIREIAARTRADTVVISIAPGLTLERLAALFGRDVKIVRCMPNTPAMVGEGMTAHCANALVTADELSRVRVLLDSCGKSEAVPEKLLDAVVAVSGSAPAYIFMVIEAMADGAVLEGLSRDAAYRFAAQAVLGSAKMVLETGLHPGALKDMVCSPAGTTIEAVRVLEERGLRSAVMEAMRACAKRSREI